MGSALQLRSPLYSVLTRPAVVNTGNFESITDCGSSGPGVDGSEKAKACFDESFKTCSLSTYKSTVDLGTQGGIVTNAYEITGKTDNSCTVESKFTQNPNAAWVNKKMVCEMDNTKTFDQALNGNSSSNCSGPLADLMYGSDTNEDENANTEN
jgi:hypothetical protein